MAEPCEHTARCPALLWHLKVSHYNEKARWALDHKRVPHTRRAPVPGFHTLVSKRLTHGEQDTLPILVLDGEVIHDSTRIIAELERRFPDPPLYPDDPAERDRALALEEEFDEVAAHVRRLAYYLLLDDPEVWARVVAVGMPEGTVRALRACHPVFKVALNHRLRIDPDGADRARVRLRESLDRLEETRAGRPYLVGDRFSVADLTAAAVLAPVVVPPGMPYTLPEPTPAFRALAVETNAHPAAGWVRDMYVHHRAAAQPRTPALATV